MLECLLSYLNRSHSMVCSFLFLLRSNSDSAYALPGEDTRFHSRNQRAVQSIGLHVSEKVPAHFWRDLLLPRFPSPSQPRWGSQTKKSCLCFTIGAGEGEGRGQGVVVVGLHNPSPSHWASIGLYPVVLPGVLYIKNRTKNPYIKELSLPGCVKSC